MKWSEQEIRVFLGMPHQREHKARRMNYSLVRPDKVWIFVDDQGRKYMTCEMNPLADLEVLRAYYHSRKWPEPEILADGHRRMSRVRENYTCGSCGPVKNAKPRRLPRGGQEVGELEHE